MAKMLKEGGNVLLLDEPTNDLDVETLRALEEALENFAGCAGGDQPRPLLPRPPRHPHPRLRGREPRRMVRRQFRSYEEDKRRRLGDEADRPHRMSYKKLTR
jgi:hypothetical protein